MKGAASLTVDPTKLRQMIPAAVKYAKDQIGYEVKKLDHFEGIIVA